MSAATPARAGRGDPGGVWLSRTGLRRSRITDIRTGNATTGPALFANAGPCLSGRRGAMPPSVYLLQDDPDAVAVGILDLEQRANEPR
jgi:hypothetical protein